MFAVAMVAVLVTMLLTLARACRGPSLFDRILAVNTFGTSTVLFIAVIGFLTGRPEFLDLGLVYALLNFIATIAVLKLHQYRHLGAGLDDEREEGA